MDNPVHQKMFVAALTPENIVQQQAFYGTPVVYFHNSDVDNEANNGIFMIGGGLMHLSASRPKTCGIALAMVALFCYFPGISMTVALVSEGITNKTIIGIVMTSIAVTLTITSIALCIRSRYLLKRLAHPSVLTSITTTQIPSTAHNKQNCYEGIIPLISIDDNISEVNMPSQESIWTHRSLDTPEVLMANKISQSFVLKRYFERMHSESGSFALNNEEMDRLNECAIQNIPNTANNAYMKHQQNTSSTDSAIEVDSDNHSFEATGSI